MKPISPAGELHISKPTVKDFCDKVRLSVNVSTADSVWELYVEVENSLGEYLCHERSDAFVVGLLRFAMAKHLDIRCETPVSEDVLYNLRTYLIPSLAKYGPDLYATRIYAVADSTELPNFGAVGTGASLGIDSMHSILHHLNSEYGNHNLTHLVLNNVGAYDPIRGVGQFDWKSAKARAFAQEVGLPLVQVNSNIADIFNGWNCYYFDLTNTYVNAFAVLALQKFWKTYYYSSWGHDFSYFSLFHINDHDSACYDLLSLPCFSTRQLRFHCDGGEKSRVEKTRDVIAFLPSRRYLHVCTDDRGPNCGRCEKCKRTLVTLDALGAIDNFREVFDIDSYISHRSDYIRWLVRSELRHGRDTYTGEAYELLKSRKGGIPFSDFAAASFKVLVSRFHPRNVCRQLKHFTSQGACHG